MQQELKALKARKPKQRKGLRFNLEAADKSSNDIIELKDVSKDSMDYSALFSTSRILRFRRATELVLSVAMAKERQLFSKLLRVMSRSIQEKTLHQVQSLDTILKTTELLISN